MSEYEKNEEIQIFREYLRIPTVQPNIDYEPCLTFLRKQFDSLGLKHQTFSPVTAKKPVIVATWKGEDPNLPSILLNSHMDVVPVFEDKWTYPPFGAEIHDGRIYARGAQDMKCVGTQYLAAIRALQKAGFKPKRTFHLSYVAEEEVGSVEVMPDFVKSDAFKALNVGFALDETMASTEDAFHLCYAERSMWHVDFTINGKPGHGLQLFQGTVGEKATYLMSKLDEFRKTQMALVARNPPLSNATTVNLTKLQGGVQSNVIPPQIKITYDMRLAIDVDHDEWVAQLHKWCDEAGGDIQITYQVRLPPVPPTKMDASNPYWVAFKAAIDELGIRIEPMIMPGATDARFIRAAGIPALGFMPINNTPVLLHDHDEFLGAETYLRGIKIYEGIIKKLGMMA